MASPEERIREKVEVLDGSRGRGAMLQAAVRIEDLAPLLQIPQLQAKAAAGATPTANEYATLVKDMTALHARLTEIAALLQGRIL